MTKIDLITGILGSGKTTFIRRYARHLIDKGMRIAILENDFGAVNADMLMLQDLKCDNCQLAMITGGGDPDCHRRRFKTQLISLSMQGFDRVIVEPSGIFDMDEFFDTLHEPPIDSWFEVGCVLTVADAETDDILTDQMEYLLGSEAACCGKLLLSKCREGDREAASERILAHINRALEFIRCDRRLTSKDVFSADWENMTDADYELLMNSGYRNSAYVKQFSFEDIHSEVHYFMNIRVPESEAEKMINGIMADERCGKIFRIKGSLPAENGEWLRINAMKENTVINRVREGQAVLIVIGDDIDRSAVDSHIVPLNTDSEYISI
ncbi:MAG: GTPase (G3E family) [Ruminococcus sp.]|nr:GTPase (G3E family) [Ruminococcus sp.]